jgi:hypothetical protein
MDLFPVRADQSAPTWGQAFGLFSLQIGAAIVVSSLHFVVPTLGGVAGSSVVAAVAAALYVVIAEKKVPGSMVRKRYQVILALWVSGLLSLLGVLSVVFYSRSTLEILISPLDMLIVGGVALFLYFVGIWSGLFIGAKYMKHRRSRA